MGKKNELVIILIIFILLLNIYTKTRKTAEGESVIRTVSNSNPVYGEIVTVTLTATLVDTNGIEDEIVSIEENIPSWTYNLGSFNIKADTNRLSKLDMGLPGGVHTYTYTVTAPTSVSTLTFAGTYVIGEGPVRDDLTAVTGTPSITSREPCNGQADRNCDGVVTQTEIVDAINNIYGSTTYFALGTFTSANIGTHITAYYGAVL